MTIAYFDCFSGASGDMILGALVDAGMPLAHLTKQLRLLPLPPYRLVRRKQPHLAGTNLHVITRQEPHDAGYAALDRRIARSRLPASVRAQARAIFERLARAEARVHRMPLARVHFHEVGAVDSLVDIVGAAIGFDFFGFESIHASPLPMSRGEVACAHGVLPVPAPATLELLKGVPLEKTGVRGELVTPTGAAVLTAVASHFGECPLQRIERAGIGFGDREIPGRPNMLRLLIGQGFPIVVVEADIDDMNPQLFAPAVEKIFQAGAADVTLQPIQMKKNRPAVRLSCLVPWEARERAIDVILAETSSFGVRYWPAERKVLTRELVVRRVRHGRLLYKVGFDAGGRALKAVPEYEAIASLARKTGRPLPEIYAEAAGMARKLVARRSKTP